MTYEYCRFNLTSHPLGGLIHLFFLLYLEKLKVNASLDVKKEAPKDGDSDHIAAHTFTFRELAAATKNFRADCLLGEGGFGRVYKGRLESTNQVCYNEFYFLYLSRLRRNGGLLFFLSVLTRFWY